MEFHGTDTSSSMEFHGTRIAPISLTRAVPWNSIDLVLRQFRWHKQFHGIPWNCSCQRNWRNTRSMEFHGIHGTACVSEIGATQDQWNSMELRVRQFRWHEQFHGIPWNLKCANFAEMRSSMEFHGTLGAPLSLTWAVPWNSMEFHGTRSAPISLTRAVPWNSMELRMRQFRWHEQFHGIPWN